MNENRRCRHCKVRKPLDEFEEVGYIAKSGTICRDTYCKPCAAEFHEWQKNRFFEFIEKGLGRETGTRPTP